ncbi:MAG TPA: phosphoglycerate kinase, partial [Alphaproteobacteria bacterium]
MNIQNADVNGKNVLIRLDLNVPVQDGVVSDFTRIDRVKPTIDLLRQKGAKIVILSHFGRPKAKVDPEFSLSFLAPVLKQRWGVPVAFANDCVGGVAQAAVAKLNDGDVLLLENVRFHAGEEKDDAAFAQQLASLGDLYVNDAFSVSHRAHASVHAIAKVLSAMPGLSMEAELNALSSAVANPKRPVAAIVGGAKVSTKLDLLGNLVTKMDYLVLGGGMANTFLASRGWKPEASLYEQDMLDT